MPAYRLKGAAEKDLREVVRYTIRIWGLNQAVRYRRQLEACLQLLSGNPSLERHCDRLQPGMRRFEVGKHVIFYMLEPEEIVIVRILHQQMLPTKSRMEA